MASAKSNPLMPFDHEVKTNVTEFARGFNHSYYQPLHSAILKGDWKSTKAFLDNDPIALTAKVTVFRRTALHVAAVGAQWKLVEKLVQYMPKDVVTELDLMGRTCLHYVAMGRSVYAADAAKALVAKNPSVTQVTDFKGFTPLINSITSTGCKEMVWYLYMNTTDETPGCPFSGASASQLVALLTAAGYHDITMHLLQRYPNLATISDSNGSSIILNVLSKLPSHFQRGQTLGTYTSLLYKSIWRYKLQTWTCFEIGRICLHTRFSSKVESVSGEAFQLIREYQWLKEVENLDNPLHKHVKNKDGKTAAQVFMEEHKPLIKEAKEWIKDRSNSCMLVAALIATITFTAGITLPGGNDANGMPLLLQEKKFLVFFLSDAVAFFFSLTSILVFISNMNGRYNKEEFVMALPERLLFGLACLFFAVIATMVAYIAAVSLFLEDRYSTSKIRIPPTFGIVLFTFLPIMITFELPIFYFRTKVYGLLFGPLATGIVVLVLLGVGASG